MFGVPMLEKKYEIEYSKDVFWSMKGACFGESHFFLFLLIYFYRQVA